MRCKKEIAKLRKKITREFKIVCDLEETLKTFEEDNRVKIDCQRQINELEQILEDLYSDMRHVYENQQKFEDTDTLNKKLEHSKLEENSLLEVNKKLHNEINQNKEYLENLNLNIKKFNRSIEELDRSNETLENQLSGLKAGKKMLLQEISQLAKTLECKDKELLCVRQQIEQCWLRTELQRGCCDVLEANVERELATEAELKTRLMETSERLERGRATLVARQESTARALRDVRAECECVKVRIADERCDIAELETQIVEQRDTHVALQRDADAREQILRHNLAAKRYQLDEIQGGNGATVSDEMVSKADAVAQYAGDMTDRLAEVERCAAEERRKLSDARSRMERELVAAKRDAHSRAAALDELGREACRLRDEEKRWRESCATSGPHNESVGDDKGSDAGPCLTAGRMDRLHVDLEQSKCDAEASEARAVDVTACE